MADDLIVLCYTSDDIRDKLFQIHEFLPKVKPRPVGVTATPKETRNFLDIDPAFSLE